MYPDLEAWLEDIQEVRSSQAHQSLTIWGKFNQFIWNLKYSFEIWKSNFNLKNYYPVWKFISNIDPTKWCHSSLSGDKVEYMHIEPLCEVHVWNKFSDRIIYFQI
jgi:hypothetical protein